MEQHDKAIGRPLGALGSTVAGTPPRGLQDTKARGESAQVLVVEDDPEMRYFLHLFLSELGYRVECAWDGAEGIEAARRSRPDLILLNMSMPGMHGLDALDRIRWERSDARVLMTTACCAPEVVERALRCGALGVLFAPYRPAEFPQAIRRALTASSRGEEPARAREIGRYGAAQVPLRRGLFRGALSTRQGDGACEAAAPGNLATMRLWLRCRGCGSMRPGGSCPACPRPRPARRRSWRRLTCAIAWHVALLGLFQFLMKGCNDLIVQAGEGLSPGSEVLDLRYPCPPGAGHRRMP